jgi:hypothetical protein
MNSLSTAISNIEFITSIAPPPDSPAKVYSDKISNYFQDISMLKANSVFALKVNQNGHLEIKSLKERICYLFFGNTAEDVKLKNLIGNVVHCYSKQMITPETEASHLTAKTFKKFIFENLASLDSKFFDRRSWFERLGKQDRKEIQNILSNEIRTIREEVRIYKRIEMELTTAEDRQLEAPQLPIEHLPATSDLKCRSRMAKAALAVRLGVSNSQNSGGATESFVLRDVTGKKLGLYKPINDGPHKIIRILGFLARRLVNINRQVHYCRNGGELSAIYSDIASSVASEHFQVNMTPGSLRIQVQEKKIDGLFLTWCNNFTDAKHVSFDTPPTQKNLELFQKMAAYDYLIGNLDRHTGNWMVNKEGEIRTIDNSNCFLDKNTTDGWSDQNIRKKQYAWKTHPFAKYPLTPDVKKFILEQFTPEKIDSYIRATNERLEKQGLKTDELLTDAVIGQLRIRAHVLTELASQINTSPAILGDLYSDTAIVTFLRHSLTA